MCSSGDFRFWGLGPRGLVMGLRTRSPGWLLIDGTRLAIAVIQTSVARCGKTRGSKVEFCSVLAFPEGPYTLPLWN